MPLPVPCCGAGARLPTVALAKAGAPPAALLAREESSMPHWWARFPVYNVELRGEATVGSVRLVPVLTHWDARQAVQKQRHSDKPFVLTASAIVDIGEHAGKPENPRDIAGTALWPVVGAVEFLWQRDVRVSEWSLHQTASCQDEATSSGRSMTMCSIPHGQPIDIFWRDEEIAIQRTAQTWANDKLADRTNFRYAAAVQHASGIPFLPVEMQFVQQWLAFEVLFSRWCDTDDCGPKDLRIPDRILQRQVRPAVEEALAPLVAGGALTEEQSVGLCGAMRSPIYQAAETKARAFLRSYGVNGFGAKWLQRCIGLRNHFLHGRRMYHLRPVGHYGDIASEVSWRTRDTRRLVNRYIMHLVGCEPEADLGPDSFERYRCEPASHDA